MLSIENEEDINLVYTMVKFHNYLRIKGVKLDLIIYNNEEVSYDEPLQKNIMEVIRSSNVGNYLNKAGEYLFTIKQPWMLKLRIY